MVTYVFINIYDYFKSFNSYLLIVEALYNNCY